MEKLNMINRFKFSMNPKRYKNFINDRLQKAILYLLIMSTLIGLIQSIKVIVAFSDIKKSFENALREDEFKFEMENGILDFEASSLKIEEGQYLLLIDTNKELKDIGLLRSVIVHKNESIVLLKDGLVIKRESGERTLKYSDLGNDLYIDNNSLINTIDKFSFLKFIFIPIAILIEFISILIYALLVSIVGVLNILFSRRKVSFSDIFKLSIYSLTIPLLLNSIFPIQRYIVLIGGFMLILALNYLNYYEKKEKI